MAVPRLYRPQAEVVDLTGSSDGDLKPLSPPAMPDSLLATTQLNAAMHSEPQAGPSTARTEDPLQALHNDFATDMEDFPLPTEEELIGIGAFDMDINNAFWGTDLVPQAQVPSSPASHGEDQAADLEYALELSCEDAFTAENCLEKILQIFPNISREYVTTLYSKFDNDGEFQALPGQARFDNIVEQLVSSNGYPKQDKGKQPLKRKREDVDLHVSFKRWEKTDRESVPQKYWATIRTILKAEFPGVSLTKIQDILYQQRYLYQAYITIATARDSGDRSFCTGKRSVMTQDAETKAAATVGWPSLLEELQAARSKVTLLRDERKQAAIKKQAEHENLQRAMERGELAECQACFDDLAMNRMIHCDGAQAHFTCFECITTYIRSEVGDARCRVLCTAGCGSGFARNQLHRLEDKALLEQLSQLEQEKAIRDAELEGLEECPFCDFKMQMPPVEENFIFSCRNPDCGQDSCRRCKKPAHIPLSCEAYAKENKLDTRHTIEEAMTAALVRSCNGCKKTFVKDFGCNKMTCPSCGNRQCYICRQTLKDYDHFAGHGRGGGPSPSLSAKCPLYDNVEERHAKEVEEAESKAKEQALRDNPHISAEDLEIQVSDIVLQEQQGRIRAAGPHGLGGGDVGFGPAFDRVNMPPHMRHMAGGGFLPPAVHRDPGQAMAARQAYARRYAMLQRGRADGFLVRRRPDFNPGNGQNAPLDPEQGWGVLQPPQPQQPALPQVQSQNPNALWQNPPRFDPEMLNGPNAWIGALEARQHQVGHLNQRRPDLGQPQAQADPNINAGGNLFLPDQALQRNNQYPLDAFPDWPMYAAADALFAPHDNIRPNDQWLNVQLPERHAAPPQRRTNSQGNAATGPGAARPIMYGHMSLQRH